MCDYGDRSPRDRSERVGIQPPRIPVVPLIGPHPAGKLVGVRDISALDAEVHQLRTKVEQLTKDLNTSRTERAGLQHVLDDFVRAYGPLRPPWPCEMEAVDV